MYTCCTQEAYNYVSQTLLPIIHEQESKAAMSKLGNQADGLKEAIRLIESAGFSVVSAQSYAGHEKALESERAFIVDNLKVRWKGCVKRCELIKFHVQQFLFSIQKHQSKKRNAPLQAKKKVRPGSLSSATFDLFNFANLFFYSCPKAKKKVCPGSSSMTLLSRFANDISYSSFPTICSKTKMVPENSSNEATVSIQLMAFYFCDTYHKLILRVVFLNQVKDKSKYQ